MRQLHPPQKRLRRSWRRRSDDLRATGVNVMQRAAAAIALLLVMSLAVPARACLWDYDTIRDEKRGLPGIAEIIAGKFEKHSRFFYEQRIVKMKAILAQNPNDLAAWDNLAV